VGKDTYHHTFFEMLGNWSFGDYFKKEAIAWAWELLTEVWKLDKTRLHVTVFEGDKEANIPRDDEAAGSGGGRRAGFAQHPPGQQEGQLLGDGGTPGRAGPAPRSTTTHARQIRRQAGQRGTDKVIEIWNLVFIQFNRNEDQSLTPLPAKHVDTGMGFERITKVIAGQGEQLRHRCVPADLRSDPKGDRSAPYTGILDDLKDTAYRVIADHIRT
jgi:alanyl-tRNA synthetase